jgi:Sugar-transfer associated ATP-grasp
MALRSLGRALEALRGRWWTFFDKRCLVGFPWYWPSMPPGQPAMMEARRLVRRYFGEDHHPIVRLLAQISATLVWPPAVLIHLWQVRRHRGQKAMPLERMAGAVWAAVRHNVLPGEYFAYELWRPRRKADIDNYLYSNEAPRLFKLLNRPQQPEPIGDKLAFHDMCKAHALPTPAVLAAFAPGGTVLDFASNRPPQRDLFVKPRLGMSGHGAERLLWDGIGFVNNRGGQVSPKDLGGYLATCAQDQKRTLLVQPVIWNHSSFRTGKNDALATARLVTGRSSDGVVVPIFGFIYFARPNSIKSQHGYVALIDVASGCLLSAPLPDGSGAKHWSLWTDAELFGHPLPDWGAAVECAKAAHQACANFVFIGWDLALSNEGPMILEGNANWTADEFQSLTGQPLGLTKFGDILADRLKNY